ncbi:hypothetical protein FNV43_RR19529 [Rhamnella rubrinervis]|uniref:Copine C-terminal domain-containing protein n=1 Tax=Rhamnella rubrinervis TaxID=2594499 RepID=A0A8K0DU81_9ROSA|nr:hypothetical protein FNV43_RR19529 [Rhamnella rubrinervis]
MYSWVYLPSQAINCCFKYYLLELRKLFAFVVFQENYPQPPPTTHPSYDYGQPHFASPQSYGGVRTCIRTKVGEEVFKIEDNYNSLEQVTDALARAGLESSNLIVGIDFTKSNEWTGARSFHRKSLHHIGEAQNPYEQAISIIGKTLSSFDEDNLIPCFGFGDGPTSFAPIIEMAITIVEQSNGQYHVLVIIADGQVTRSIDTERGQLSPQEKKTVEAIVKARNLMTTSLLVPLITSRQFVNFTEIMSKNMDRSRKEAEFALSALMEIPSQYKATLELNILGASRGNAIDRVCLPPPHYGSASISTSKHARSSNFRPSAPSAGAAVGRATPASSASDNHPSSPPPPSSSSSY